VPVVAFTVVGAVELRRLVIDGDIGAVAGSPLVVVDDDEAGLLDGWAPGAFPAVFVARRARGWDDVPPSDHPCDIVVAADDPLLPGVVDHVERHPLAAVAAAVLLRSTPHTDVEAGLAAESAVYSMLQAGPEFTDWLRRRRPAAPVVDDEPPVLVERDGDTLTIVLNRAHSHNAVNESLRAALVEALSIAVIDHDIATVVLRGNGPSFCSGGDLREFGSFPDVATAHAARLTRSPGRLAHLLRDRLRVELHGACLGAGIELAAFAGTVTAATGCRIGLPELGIGLIPGAGGTVSVPRRIGRHRTLLLALSGETIDEQTAAAWGLVDEIVRRRRGPDRPTDDSL
jgi:enoyl-CoA hydratase/carnithine racemase